GPRLEEAVVDVRAQRVERDAAVRIAFGPRHLGPAEATRDLDLDPFGAGAHRRGQRPFHRPPERNPVLELLGDRLGDQFGVELGALHLADVHFHRLAGQLVELLAEGVYFAARLADHDPRAGRVDVDRDLAAALDRDLGQARVREFVLDVGAD